MNNKNKIIYLCDYCGEESNTWSGKCRHCGSWNTLKEMKVSKSKGNIGNNIYEEIEIKKIDQISTSNDDRFSSGLSEIDRVLGGGFVRGSVILLGGEPGIGKSTITTQLCQLVPKTLYISAEESLPQIKNRTDRLKIDNKNLLIASGGDLLQLEKKIVSSGVDLLIIDSIQTVFLSDIDSGVGSLSQVRESGIFLQRLAKRHNIATIIIGHVTKEGSIAGPKIIEHLVDVVLYLEGDRNHEGRIIRGIKNRFGNTNEIGLFMMSNRGLEEVKNPSEIFLSQRENKPGSVICPVVEGKRILFIEVQALTLITKYGYAKRTASGYDLNRLNLLSAVIQKILGIDLSICDIYLNIIGGIKIKEPASDLAVCAAIISSYKNKAFPEEICFFGEVGLMGEVRKVVLQEERKKESKKMGFSPISGKEIATISNIMTKLL